jgi:hypothetical protein
MRFPGPLHSRLPQWLATGPGAHPPLPFGVEAFGLQGSQQPGMIWQPLELL